MQKLLSALANYFQSKSINSYLVGGCIRDRLLNRRIKDYDLMLEGDIVDVFKNMYKEQDFECEIEKPIIFKKFKTAKVTFLDSSDKFDLDRLELDFASARKEFYPEIATRPDCTFDVDLEQDLKRRDFTINAMASPLNNTSFVIDYFNSQNDLENGLIRVLHEQSFHDDPCRIIRAYRFLKRFNFKIENETESLVMEAIDKEYASYLKPKRSNDELLKVLSEDRWFEVLEELKEIEVLKQFNSEFDALIVSGDKNLSSYIKVIKNAC